MEQPSKKILFDATLLTPYVANRGIPRVILDFVNVIYKTPELKSKVDFAVHSKSREYFLNMFPDLNSSLVRIPSFIISQPVFHGIFSDFRYRIDEKKYHSIFIPDYRTLRFSCKVRQIVFIHDMLYYNFWKRDLLENFNFFRLIIPPFLLYKHYKIKYSQMVYCNSNYTRQEVIKRTKLNPDACKVVYLKTKAIRELTTDRYPDKVNILKSQKYLLYVGGFDARKNIALLIEHIGNFCKEENVILVLAGSANLKSIDYFKRQIAQSELKETVLLLNNLNEESLAFLYRNAEVFTFYSLAEGFGLPLVEAMSVGLPVVAFDNTAVSEVVAGAGILVPDNDHEGFIKAVRNLLYDPNLRQKLSEAGILRAQKFSDEQFRKSVVEIFTSDFK